MFMSMEWPRDDPQVKFMFRNVAEKINPFTGEVTRKAIPLHDAILPETLLFPVPLVDEASNAAAFGYHWQQLTYAFNLPSPASFPALDIPLGERDVLVQYAKNCRKLARYTIFNDDRGKLSVVTKGGHTSIDAVLPTDEAFTGASARFRQLHNPHDLASFDKVKKVLEAALRTAPSSKRIRGRAVLREWSSARKTLSRKMVETVIAEKLVGDEEERPFYSYEGVNPSNLITTYNYGDTLHWGNTRDSLQQLTADSDLEKFWMHCVVNSIVKLGHFYFGFAIAVESALREHM